MTNFAQHLSKASHIGKVEVQRLESLRPQPGDNDQTKKEKEIERKRQIELLRHSGDHEHNNRVLSQKRGELLLRRRVTEELDISQFGPCPTCYEWVTLGSIMWHQTKCPGNPSWDNKKGSVITQSLVMCGRVASDASPALVSEVFPIKRQDQVSLVAKNDQLIIMLGNVYMDGTECREQTHEETLHILCNETCCPPSYSSAEVKPTGGLVYVCIHPPSKL